MLSSLNQIIHLSKHLVTIQLVNKVQDSTQWLSLESKLTENTCPEKYYLYSWEYTSREELEEGRRKRRKDG